MSFDPTPEQQESLDKFATGGNLVIEAGAGTGKTATLILLAGSTRRRGQYIAFNKAIVEESRSKFPSTVNCSTAHSLAYRAIAAGTPFQERMRTSRRMRSNDIAMLLGIDALNLRLDGGESKRLSPGFLAGLTMNTIVRFCQSADDAPSRVHVPRVSGLEPDGYWDVNRVVAKHVESYVKAAWADLQKHDGRLPFTTSIAMSVFLKLWQLSNPRIGADYILFDEAQDANPVMVAVVAAQTHAQIVWVGDSQQQIYGFTGAINALASVPFDERTFLTQSFRFGPAVADIANHVLGMIESAELRLTGYDKISSVVAPVAEPDVVLTRTNAEAVRTVLEAIRVEKKVHLVGGGHDVIQFCKAALALQRDERTDHPELAPFESWGEVQTYVEEDEQGGEIKLLVKLIDEFGAQVIIDALDTQGSEDDADLVVSTAHKSKGRQWGSVQIAGDFDEERIAKSDDEKRLLYVAVTRAQYELDIDALPMLRDGYIPTVTDESKPEQKPVSKVEVETVETKTPDYVGEVGGRWSGVVTAEFVMGSPTRYGGYMHKLVTEQGDVIKTFLHEQLEEGKRYEIEARVKAHGEFRGIRETTVNYVDVVQEVTV